MNPKNYLFVCRFLKKILKNSKILVRFTMWSKIFKACHHGLVRGVAIYSITWPLSSVIQQSLDPSASKDIDLKRAAKFSIYGGLYVAPTLYAWMQFASYIWPSRTITSHIIKVRTFVFLRNR